MHLSAPEGWLNDPNGFVRWAGRYHLFFQHHPSRALWGPPAWAHVVSDDLVHWTGRPPALTPAMPPEDPDGCWSGSTVLVGDRPVVYYTGVAEGEQRTCRAVPLDDELERWVKDDGNPIVRAPDDRAISHGAYRDPYVWPDGDGYRMIVGTSRDDRGDAFLYASDDGYDWRLLGPLVDDANRVVGAAPGRVWECPLLLRGHVHGAEHDLLLVGAWDLGRLSHVDAYLGRFRRDRFVPEVRARFDHGEACFYAPQAIERDGRWTLVGWLQEQRPDDQLLAAGWAGALSLPREVWIDAGEVRQAFAPELAMLRRSEVAIERRLVPGRDVTLPIDGATFETRLRFRRNGAEACEVDLRVSPDGEERTRLRIDWTAREVRIDKRETCRRSGPSTADQVAPHPAMADDVELHLHVDGSVVEALVDERVAISTRIYPDRPDATRVHARSFAPDGAADGAAAEVRGAAWSLTPVAPATLPAAEESPR